MSHQSFLQCIVISQAFSRVPVPVISRYTVRGGCSLPFHTNSLKTLLGSLKRLPRKVFSKSVFMALVCVVNRVGGEKVMLLSAAAWGAMTAFTPILAHFCSQPIVSMTVSRFLMGLLQGEWRVKSSRESLIRSSSQCGLLHSLIIVLIISISSAKAGNLIWLHKAIEVLWL